MNGQLILLRHGQSVWNQQNLFTGWVDVPLSFQGVQEALQAGEVLRSVPIDAVFTSTLLRAQMTLTLALLDHCSGKFPVLIHPGDLSVKEKEKIHSNQTAERSFLITPSSELNERAYGKLQGLNKKETAQEFGEEAVQKWRRSFTSSPPGGESLQETSERVLPFFQKTISPHLDRGESVLVVAHGNSLRAIVMWLEALSEQEIVQREIPTGIPLFYTQNNGKWVTP